VLDESCIRDGEGKVKRVFDGRLVEDVFLTEVVMAIEGVYRSHARRALNRPSERPPTTPPPKSPNKDYTLVLNGERTRDKDKTIVQDSGSSRDIVCNPNILHDIRTIAPVHLITGNGECEISQEGTARVTRIDGRGRPTVVSRPMLLDTRLPVNIASTGRMDHIHHRSIIHQNGQLVILKHPIRIHEEEVLVRGRLMPTLLYRWDDECDVPLDVNERYSPKKKERVNKMG